MVSVPRQRRANGVDPFELPEGLVGLRDLHREFWSRRRNQTANYWQTTGRCLGLDDLRIMSPDAAAVTHAKNTLPSIAGAERCLRPAQR